jgi:hypothetical protein
MCRDLVDRELRDYLGMPYQTPVGTVPTATLSGQSEGGMMRMRMRMMRRRMRIGRRRRGMMMMMMMMMMMLPQVFLHSRARRTFWPVFCTGARSTGM